MELDEKQKQIARYAYQREGFVRTSWDDVYAAVAAVLEAERTPEPALTCPTCEADNRTCAGADGAVCERTPEPAPAAPGGALRECMAIFNGPPDQPDGNGMNAVIKIARRGYYSAGEIEKALRAHWDGPGDYDSPDTFVREIFARLSPAQEQKEKQ